MTFYFEKFEDSASSKPSR